MWFVFPQIWGLGDSPMPEKFAITSLDEANAFWEHPVLGPCLEECTGLVLAVEGRSAEEIFGYPDYLRFRSCMTLFAECAGSSTLILSESLLKYFEGEADHLTLGILEEVV